MIGCNVVGDRRICCLFSSAWKLSVLVRKMMHVNSCMVRGLNLTSILLKANHISILQEFFGRPARSSGAQARAFVEDSIEKVIGTAQ